MLKDNRGFTLVEVIVSAGLLALALVGTLMLLLTMLSMWSKGVSGTSANTYAGLAMRELALEIEEGIEATMLDTATDPDSGRTYGTRLQVSFPYYVTSTGNYDRTVQGSTAVYYLSGDTGVESSGTTLWKSVDGNRTRLARNVESVNFFVTNGTLVRINLIGRDVEGGSVSPNFLQQSVKLRNS